EFTGSLKVERPGNAKDTLRIAYESSDPIVAAAAAKAVVSAFEKYHDEETAAQTAKRLKSLDELVSLRQKELEKVDLQLDSLTQDVAGVDNLSLAAAKTAQADVERNLRQTRFNLAQMRSGAQAAPATQGSLTAMSLKQLAMVDGDL